jgi:hypothetical protein
MNQIRNKMMVLILVSLTFIGCSQSGFNYNFKKNGNSLLFNDGTKVEFSKNSIQKDWMERCVSSSYTIFDENSNFGKLFVESVTLDSNCKWRGLAISAFKNNLEREVGDKNIEVVESIEKKNISFRTFKVGDSYISLINIYDVSTEKFILDYSGKLYTKLISYYDKSYVDKYSSEKRFTKTYNDSLVRKNFFFHYFYKEIEKVDRL